MDLDFGCPIFCSEFVFVLVELCHIIAKIALIHDSYATSQLIVQYARKTGQ
jgi:hypothetical protein